MYILIFACLVNAFVFETAKSGEYSSRGQGVPLDDSWIHYIYAQSFATTFRLDYNPGESEAGFTSLLWIILQTPGVWLGVWPPVFAKVLGLLAHILCAALVFDILKKNSSVTIAFGAALIVALDPLMAFSSMSGMETTLYAAVLLLALKELLDARWRMLGLALAACVLARPDGIIMVFVTWFCLALARIRFGERRRDDKLGFEHLVWIVGLPLAAAGLWMAYNQGATGHLFPTSYYARSQGLPGVFNWQALAVLKRGLADTFPLMQSAVSVAFIVAGFVGFIFSPRRFRLLAIALLPAMLALLMGGRVIEVIGGTFPGNRYLVPIFPFLVLAAGSGVAFIDLLIYEKAFKHRNYAYLIETMTALLLIFALSGLPYSYFERSRLLKTTFADYCRDIHNMQESFGDWVRDNVPEDAAVCVFDAGAIRYLGERETVDILGLNTAGFPPQNPAEVRRRCGYLITYPVHSKDLIEALTLKELHRIDLPDNQACADRLMVAFEI